MKLNKKNHVSIVNPALVLGIVAAGVLIGSGSAHANGTRAESRVIMEAQVPSMCAFDTPFEGTVQFQMLANGKPDSSAKIETTAQVTCNAPASVELSSTNERMMRVPPPQQLSDPYVVSFDYTATLLNDTTTILALNTADGPTASAASAFAEMPTEAALKLEILPEHVAGVLQSGLYRDELTIQVIPQ